MSGIYLPNPLSFEDIENRLTNTTIEKQKIKNMNEKAFLKYVIEEIDAILKDGERYCSEKCANS